VALLAKNIVILLVSRAAKLSKIVDAGTDRKIDARSNDIQSALEPDYG